MAISKIRPDEALEPLETRPVPFYLGNRLEMKKLLRNDLAKFCKKNKKQLYQNEKSRLYHFLLRFLLSILRV